MSQAEGHDNRSTSKASPPALLNEPPIMSFYPDRPFNKFHHHSISASTTVSTESSPTTTISTADDSSATEPSPGSSPESPPPSTFTAPMIRPHTAHDSGNPFFELQKQPPPRKGRNLKNLAVNTSRNSGRAASTTSLALNTPQPLAVSVLSPTFVKPPSPPQRKLSNLGLTLLTPGVAKAVTSEQRLIVASSPSISRPGTLRHFQSSPSLPLTANGTVTTLSHRKPSLRPLGTLLSPIFSPVDRLSTSELELGEQSFEIPLSREEKPQAYPDGPICIYEPYVDLYLEPTAEECRLYDVVMNVASEVKNPLIACEDPTPEDSKLRLDGGGGIQYAPRRQGHPARSINEGSHTDGSPTTPRATTLPDLFPAAAQTEQRQKDPEYIHIPWEHNTDIVPDLLRLVKIIEARAKECKRILIHCQCGVSRSASLTVAYGIYMDPSRSVQEAYDTVKRKSKWIGPNMNLIMQLQEFRTSLIRGGSDSEASMLTPNTPGSALSGWHRPYGSDSDDPPVVQSPGAGSLPSHVGLAPTVTTHSTGGVEALPRSRERAISAATLSSDKPTPVAFVSPSGRVVPMLRVITHSESHDSSRPISTSDNDITSVPTSPDYFAMAPLSLPHEHEPVDNFGVMSPTSSSFQHGPLDRAALLASLGMGSVHGDELPRRSLSLRQKMVPQVQTGRLPTHSGVPRLRARISAPSLREQQHLQSLQAKIAAAFPGRTDTARTGHLPDVEEALSPRSETFTQNPFALSTAMPKDGSDKPLAVSAPGDPRSPVSTSSPITRNILDVL